MRRSVIKTKQRLLCGLLGILFPHPCWRKVNKYMELLKTNWASLSSEPQ